MSRIHIAISYYGARVLYAFFYLTIALLAFALLYASGLGALVLDLLRQTQNQAAIFAGTVGGIAGTTVALVELFLSLWRDHSASASEGERLQVVKLLNAHGSPPISILDMSSGAKRRGIKMPDAVIERRLFELILTGQVISQFVPGTTDRVYAPR